MQRVKNFKDYLDDEIKKQNTPQEKKNKQNKSENTISSISDKNLFKNIPTLQQLKIQHKQ